MRIINFHLQVIVIMMAIFFMSTLIAAIFFPDVLP